MVHVQNCYGHSDVCTTLRVFPRQVIRC